MQRQTRKINAEFPGVLVFCFGISKGSSTILWNFQEWSFVFSGISRGKVKKWKIPEGFSKSMSSTLLHPVWLFFWNRPMDQLLLHFSVLAYVYLMEVNVWQLSRSLCLSICFCFFSFVLKRNLLYSSLQGFLKVLKRAGPCKHRQAVKTIQMWERAVQFSLTFFLSQENVLRNILQHISKVIVPQHVVCSEFNNLLHFKCSKLSYKDYLGYQQKTFLYTWQFCTDYKCIKCEKHVYYGQKGILCSGCDLWIYNKCAGLNNSTYELIQSNPNDPWYCRPCKYVMFPFLDSQKLIKPKPSLNKQVTKNIIAQFVTKTTL